MEQKSFLTFCIDYIAGEDEYLSLNLSYRSSDKKLEEKTLVLRRENQSLWHSDTTIYAEDTTMISYSYQVRKAGRIIREESLIAPRTYTVEMSKDYSFHDVWTDNKDKFYLDTLALKKCLGGNDIANVSEIEFSRVFHLKVDWLFIPKGWELHVVGNAATLGAWNPERAVRLFKTSDYTYEVKLNVFDLSSPLEYKYILVDKNRKEKEVWEEGENRKIELSLDSRDRVDVYIDIPRFDNYKPRFAGVVVPVFSLRSKHSYGIGDFGDLEQLVYWAALTGQHLIQILPINDTTCTGSWKDSYPYNSISVFALHPVYISINHLEGASDIKEIAALEAEREEVNSLPEVDYEKAYALKMKCLRIYFEKNKRSILSSKAFKSFVEENKEWLFPYSSFCCLRDFYGTPCFDSWGDFCRYDEKKLTAYFKKTENSKSQKFYYFLQFVCFSQMQRVHAVAGMSRVVIKGDIPIGVCRYSTPAWVNPELFHFDMTAGAPPDAFATDGQNWGFPTYNWEKMKETSYDWWKKRLRIMSSYCDAYRIDHVLGFFRIWEIPSEHISGTMGHFNPTIPLTEAEIKKYLPSFSGKEMTEPYLTEDALEGLFGNLIKEAKKFLSCDGKDRWKLKKEYSTQRGLESYFCDKKSEDEQILYTCLKKAIEQVLFLVDNRDARLLYPNIIGKNTWGFKSMSDSDKMRYCNLYDNYFYHRHNDFWAKNGYDKLSAVAVSTKMLPCAEDLGMIPDCVPSVLEKLNILSLEIERMPKLYGEIFGNTDKYKYLSVSTFSTHDMSPLRKWWQENRSLRLLYAKERLKMSVSPEEQISASLCQKVIGNQLASPSMICALALQDWLSIDESIRLSDPMKEQINDPSNPNQYWNYRMHIYMEDLMDCDSLNTKILNLVRAEGRSV